LAKKPTNCGHTCETVGLSGAIIDVKRFREQVFSAEGQEWTIFPKSLDKSESIKIWPARLI
jgi:hypothetical protein